MFLIITNYFYDLLKVSSIRLHSASQDFTISNRILHFNTQDFTTMKIMPAHREWLELYIVKKLSATQAYMQVYSGCTIGTAYTGGNKLLNDPVLKAEIEIRRAEFNAQFQLTREDLVKSLLELIDNCKSNPNRVDRGNWNTAVKSLAQILGFDVHKVEITDKTQRIKVITDKFIDGTLVDQSSKILIDSGYTDATLKDIPFDDSVSEPVDSIDVEDANKIKDTEQDFTDKENNEDNTRDDI